MKKVIIFIILLLVSPLYLCSQYSVEIKNLKKVSNIEYEFDVYIKSAKNLNLTSYQGCISFDEEVKIDSIRYVSGTSELTNKVIKTGVITIDGSQELMFASNPGQDVISKTPVKIGKFKIINNTGFSKKVEFNLKWNFDGKMITIFTGTDFNETTDDFVFKPK